MRTIEQYPAIASPGGRAQRRIKRQWIAAKGPCQRECQVGLIDIARRDSFLQLFKGADIAADRKLRFERADRRRTAGCMGTEPGGDVCRPDHLMPGKCSEPQQRSGGAIARGRQRCKPRLEREAGFISQKPGQLMALPAQHIEPFQRRRNLVRAARHHDFERRTVEPRIAGLCGPRIVEQDEGFRHRRRLLAVLSATCKKPLAQLRAPLYLSVETCIRSRSWTIFFWALVPLGSGRCCACPAPIVTG